MIDVVNKFNMVDMGGIDIVESQGVAVDGLFSRLLTAIQNCRYQVLYNWKFAKIEIAPSYVELVFDGEKVSINEAITVTEDDVVHVHSLEPEPVVPVIEPLSVTENGMYEAPKGIDGFNPVTVDVAFNVVPIVVTISGGYNGGALVKVFIDNTVIYSGTGNSPYNLTYTPSEAEFVYDGVSGSISLPAITQEDPRLIVVTYGSNTENVYFNSAGPNSSYGYGNQSKVIIFR